MDEVAANFIDAGIDVWNKLIEFSLSLLQLTPETYNTQAWSIIEKLNNRIFVPVASVLIVYFFLFGFFENMVDVHKAFRPETIFILMVKLSVANGLVALNLPIVKAVFQVGANMVTAIISVAGGPNGATQIKSNEMIAYISDSGTFAGLGYLALHLIVVPVICVMAIMIFYTVLIRMIKILCIIPYGSFAFATTAGGNSIGASRTAFIKYMICCAGEASFIVIALIIGTTITNKGGLGLTKVFNIDTASGWNFSRVFFNELELIITCVVVVGIVKSGQSILQKALNL